MVNNIDMILFRAEIDLKHGKSLKIAGNSCCEFKYDGHDDSKVKYFRMDSVGHHTCHVSFRNKNWYRNPREIHMRIPLVLLINCINC